MRKVSPEHKEVRLNCQTPRAEALENEYVYLQSFGCWVEKLKFFRFYSDSRVKTRLKTLNRLILNRMVRQS
jgi:hypothetical protein